MILVLGFDVVILIILLLLVRLMDFCLELVVVFMVMWFLMNVFVKYKVIIYNVFKNIMNVVCMGVLLFILLDVVMVVGFFGKFWLGLVVLLFLFLFIVLVKKFVVI